jgi:hypothetical protein
VDSLDRFLEFSINKIIADQCVPIDLGAISGEIGAVVEEREMIPEAAMQVKGGRFHIYLQSNFKDLPGITSRRRFSLAHEIGHTLFYEKRDGKLKPRKDAPKGDGLEAACHKAASMILVPNKALRAEVRQRKLDVTSSIVELAGRFEVSIEVMLRRLNDLGVFESGWVPILTRRSGEELAIEYATYPPWLKSHFAAPKRGMAFAVWFRAAEQSDGKFKRETADGALEASPVKVTTSLIMLELRMQCDPST